MPNAHAIIIGVYPNALEVAVIAPMPNGINNIMDCGSYRPFLVLPVSILLFEDILKTVQTL